MHFPHSLLVVVGSVLLICCSSRLVEDNHLMPRLASSNNLPYKYSSDSSSRQPIRGRECTRDNISVRREWRTLSRRERRHYIDAVLCLQSVKPALYENDVQGASSRYVDFQITHINQTAFIHANAVFLAWHRWFTWRYEEALRQECGFKGSQPYWDWTLDAHNIEASPIFDGSDHSLSGNGVAVPHGDIPVVYSFPDRPTIETIVPAGTGGGCVTTGPFANLTVAFGEISPGLSAELFNNPHNLDYKPHCLRRDLSPRAAEDTLTAEQVRNLLNSPNITVFNRVLDIGVLSGVRGVHPRGHQVVGGAMADSFTSPGDPIFYLHHTQLDRLWTQWQQFDPNTRQYALSGTGTAFNYPPSPDFQLNDTINLGKLSPKGPRPIRDFMSTVRGPFCYEYA